MNARLSNLFLKKTVKRRLELKNFVMNPNQTIYHQATEIGKQCKNKNAQSIFCPEETSSTDSGLKLRLEGIIFYFLRTFRVDAPKYLNT